MWLCSSCSQYVKVLISPQSYMHCYCCCVLTVVDEADRGDGLEAGTHSSSFDLLKAIRQAAEEVLPLFVEAEPQIQLQLGLDRPACGAEALLTRQLQTQFITAMTTFI